MRVLKRGMFGYDVARWQDFLVKLEPQKYDIGIDGDFGPRTHAATVDLQETWKLTKDGIVGKDTRREAELHGFKTPRGPDAFPAELLDPNSRALLCTVHPVLADRIVNLVKRTKDLYGIASFVASGYRTFARQQELYNQGRIPPPPDPERIVTKAKPGQSYHNYGLAVDVHTVRLPNGNLHPEDGKHSKLRGDLAKVVNLAWGGKWTDFPDLPHWQLTTGLSIAECSEHYKQGGIIKLSQVVSSRAANFPFDPSGEIPEGDHVNDHVGDPVVDWAHEGSDDPPIEEIG